MASRTSSAVADWVGAAGDGDRPSWRRRGGVESLEICVEGVVDLTVDVALEAADDLAFGEAFGGAAGGVGAGAWAVAESADGRRRRTARHDARARPGEGARAVPPPPLIVDLPPLATAAGCGGC
jgi:hypothetical protein